VSPLSKRNWSANAAAITDLFHQNRVDGLEKMELLGMNKAMGLGHSI
jgi:hypothetical protein